MASHVSPALTTPVGLHVGLLSAPHAPNPRDTLHLSTGVYKADHQSAAEAAAMYYYHHHRAAYLSGSEPKNQQFKESANSVYANNRSSFMIDDILSKSRKTSEESPEKVANERRDSKDQRVLDHIVIDKDRYVIERRSSDDSVHTHRDRYPSGYSSHDRYEVVAVRRRSPSPTGGVGSSLQGSARSGLVARVSSTTGSPTSTVGRPVSPTVVVRKRSSSPASSPRSPSHYDHHHSGDRHLSGSHYEHTDHHQHRHQEHHLHNGTSEHYRHSSPMSTGRHHHTVHHQHHHQQQHQQTRLLQIDTRDIPRGHGGTREGGCRSRSPSPPSPPSGDGSPRTLTLPLPARPTPIHPTAVHANSSALTSAPTVQDIYGTLPRSSGSEHIGALAVPAPVSLPGVPPPPPSITHHGAAPTAALSMVYDPLTAATLASPYLQSPLGAYPAPPAVYSLPPYTRPEHYAFLARHHPCKYKLRISRCTT